MMNYRDPHRLTMLQSLKDTGVATIVTVDGRPIDDYFIDGVEPPEFAELMVEFPASSNVASIHYYSPTQDLTVNFQNMRESSSRGYVYPGITWEMYADFIRSASAGKFVWAALRRPGAVFQRVS